MDPCPISIILLYFPIPIVYTKKTMNHILKLAIDDYKKNEIKATTISIRLFRNIYYYLYMYIYIKKKERKKESASKAKQRKKNRSILRCKTIQWWNKKKTRSRNAINYAVAFNLNNTVLCQHFFRIFFFFSSPFFSLL